MHEMKIVRRVADTLASLGKTRAVVVLGALKAVDEPSFKALFADLSDAEVSLQILPLLIKCGCGFEGEIRLPPGFHSHVQFDAWQCPRCAKKARIVQGNEEMVRCE